jgi:hypothetical protein
MKAKRRRTWEPSLAYGFVRARQLDGSLAEGPSVGVYGISFMRIAAGWGCVSAKRYPRSRHLPWPPPEPPGLDRIARFNRSLGHFRARDVDDARRCISRMLGLPVCCLPIHADWATAKGGIINLPSVTTPLDGRSHSVCLVGYNDDTRLFRFWHNWGSGWGENGHGYLPYEYFTLHVEDAWAMCIPLGYQCPAVSESFAVLERGFTNRLDNPWFIADLWNTSEGIRIGWCMATIRDGWFEVEDFFIRPDHLDNKTHRRVLLTRVVQMAMSRGLRLRFWIPHADIRYRAANFATTNDIIREAKLTVKPSGVTWAAYRAERTF